MSHAAKDGTNDKAREIKVKKRKTDQSEMKNEECSDSVEFSEDNDEYMEYKDSNAVNNLMSKMYKKTKKQISHSAPVSAASSPKRPDTANQAPDLCKSLFVIDRSGNKKENPADTILHSLASSTPRITKSKTNYSIFDEVSLVCDSKNNKLENIDEKEVTVSRSMTSPDDVDRSLLEKHPGSKRSKEDDVSVKSSAGIKKKKKTSEKESKRKTPELKISSVTFADVGGNESVLKEVCKLLVHMKHPEVYKQLGVTPPRGFLLHGPPGCGKTLLANAIAGELQLPYIKIAATEVVSGVSGESEEKLRDIFDKAIQNSPCILFIDEIDSITQKRENASKDMERRIVAQLLSCMDELNSKPDIQVLVIGATNRADSLDPALRRAGRFDREISMGIPGEAARKSILEVLCKGLRLNEYFDYLHLARLTPGFVGADLMALAREAAIIAVNRVFNDLQKINKWKIVSNKDCEIPELSEQFNESDISDIKNNFETESKENTSGLLDTEEEVKVLHNSVETSRMEKDSINPTGSRNHCDASISMEIEEAASDINKKGSVTPQSCMSCNMNNDKNLCEYSIDSDYKIVLKWLKDQPPLSDDELKTLFITMSDFEAAIKHVQPSAKREGFATIPDVTWEDIGALKDVRGELEMAILAPVRHPEQFQSLGLTNPPGILLAGPPGCGKTLLAKAVANESGLNFISVKGPELLNMYVGESERAVRQVFQRARNSAPCVIFFDELDALCPRRSGGSEGGSSVRVVNQLLTEMDGLEERKQVFVMGATNRPDIIDPAILRPGRLDKQLYVGLPAAPDRLDIMNTLTKYGKKPKLSDDVDLSEIALDKRCECFTGADLAALVREASVIALKEYMSSSIKSQEHVSVCKQHFQLALDKVRPSVSKMDMLVYNKMKETLDVS